MVVEDRASELEMICVQVNENEAINQIVEQEEKNYYCQRCLNHGELNPRKGHKPDCGYLKCPCAECTMVEQRRQLNNLLSKKKVHISPNSQVVNGKRVRDPHCARCSAHGVLVPLRGHKRTMCQFFTCTCNLCGLVENRRNLMAAQIKLRRSQQKNREIGKLEQPIKIPRKACGIVKKRGGSVDSDGGAPPQQIRLQATRRAGSPPPSPSSSTTSTMSPSFSVSPPPTPPPSANLVAPVPIYPIHMIHAQMLLNNYLHPVAVSEHQHPVMTNEQFAMALANLYIRGVLRGGQP